MTPVAPAIAMLFLATVMAMAKLPPELQEKLPPPATARIDFKRDIQPLMEASCVKCHGRGKAKGGFSLDTRESFIKGGDSGAPAEKGRSAESLLIELVSGLNADSVMPVKGSKLTSEQVGLLRAWIDQDMPWPSDVSFARKPPLNLYPRSTNLPPGDARANPVDRWMSAYFEGHNLKPAPPVDDRVYARRVYLDIVGLLPSPVALAKFLKDKRADKRERLVESLLADNHRYAEHWLSFWNDLLRNDYKGAGYIDGGRAQISTWLYRSLHDNTPFDRFVSELVSPSPKSEGFVKGIVWRGTVNASQIPPMQAAQNVSQVFMGVNLKCASCHDSFINDWALSDAYGLANIFADEPLEIFQCDKPTGKKAGVAFLYPELGSIPAGVSREVRMKRLAAILTQKQNGRLTRTVVNRLWHRFLGRGLVEPIDDMEQPSWNPELLDWLAEDLAAHDYDLKRTMKLILTSRAYQLPSVSMDEQRQLGFVFNGPAVRRMTAEQFRDALGTLTGVWHSKAAGGISVPAEPADSQPLPASLKWIWADADAATRAMPETVYFRKTIMLSAAPEQAWAAAAADNSYTLYVNGTKVATGSQWSEPDLIDLRPHLKKGTNVLSVAAVNHTASNQPPDEAHPSVAADANPAGFILFARIQAGKITNDIRTDNSWAWSRTKQDGWEKPGVPFTGMAAAELGLPSVAPWNLSNKLASTVAMIQPHHDIRASLVAADPLTLALGRPAREQVVSARLSGATTLQALELTNGDTLSKLLERGAARLLAEKPRTTAALVTDLYAKALGRKPTAGELKICSDFPGTLLKKEEVEDLLWSVTMLPEFQVIY
ncbi:MAG: hypothetical protein QOF48_2268 [Verrucomicrobiota bacterium]|jgi:mono/diheme cytochrome c family protein